jgi:hypothetical protein
VAAALIFLNQKPKENNHEEYGEHEVSEKNIFIESGFNPQSEIESWLSLIFVFSVFFVVSFC